MKMNKEEWRPIPGFPGYEVSNLGQVRSFLRFGLNSPIMETYQRILKHYINRKGYHYVTLRRYKKNHSRKVCTLVLKAFVGPRPNDYECCHLDDNKDHNYLSNLKWGTHQENTIQRDINGKTPRGIKVGRAKLSTEQVIEIRSLWKNRLFSRHELAQKYSVTYCHINSILRYAQRKYG